LGCQKAIVSWENYMKVRITVTIATELKGKDKWPLIKNSNRLQNMLWGYIVKAIKLS